MELIYHILHHLYQNPDGEPEHKFEDGPHMSTELIEIDERHAHIQTRGIIDIFPKSYYGFGIAFTLIKVSKLFYRQAIDILYQDSIFALRIGDHGAMHKFLTKIGESNRSKIRYLCLDWAACSRRTVRFMDEETGDLVVTADDDCYGIEGETWESLNRRNMHYLSQMFRTLTLLQRGPPLHWLLLSLPKVQTAWDFCVVSHDVLHSDRFREACALVKVHSLWLWDTPDLSRGRKPGKRMRASTVFMQREGLPMNQSAMRHYRKRGWEIGSWAVSKRLNPTAGSTKGQTNHASDDTCFLLDFEVYCDD